MFGVFEQVLLFTLLFAVQVLGLASRTVDDNDGQIVYTPASSWTFGPSCQYCASKPDASQASDGTWHDNFHTARDGSPFTAQLTFTGTAVYVYCIRPRGSGETSDITFQIDGQTVGHYKDTDLSGNGFQYNTLIFSKESLPSASHTLTILNGVNANSDSLLLLDSIVYTYETAEDTTTPGQGSPPGSTSTTGAESTKTPTPPDSQHGGTTTVTTTASGKSSTTSGSSSFQTSSTLSTSSTSSTSSKTNAADALGNTSATSSTPSESSTWLSSPSSASSNSSKTPLIVGIVVGIVGAIILILLIPLVICLRRRRKRQQYLNQRAALPFTPALRPSPPSESDSSLPLAAPTEPRFILPALPPHIAAAIQENSSTTTTTTSSMATNMKAAEALGTSRAGAPAPNAGQRTDVVPVETAMTLVAEVQRLRDILRSQGQDDEAEEVQPPPYLNQDTARR